MPDREVPLIPRDAHPIIEEIGPPKNWEEMRSYQQVLVAEREYLEERARVINAVKHYAAPDLGVQSFNTLRLREISLWSLAMGLVILVIVGLVVTAAAAGSLWLVSTMWHTIIHFGTP